MILSDIERRKYLVQYLIKNKIASNQEKLGLLMGYKNSSAFSQVINGKANLPKDFISKFKRLLPDLNEEWVLSGEGQMLISEDATIPVPYTINQKHQGVPYYDVDFIGGFDVVVNDQSINPAYHIDFADYSKADCWVNVTGHSMEPTVSHGDIVALRELKEWEDHILFGEIYAIITNEYRTIKRVRRSTKGDDYFLIIPTNHDYDEQDIPKRIIKKVYQVLGAAKKLF